MKLERLTERSFEPDNACEMGVSPVKLRRSSVPDVCSHHDVSLCFFCDQEAGVAGLHEVSTMGMDQTIRTYATELKDTNLLAKLAPGDMVALEAKYHKSCLADIFNRYGLSHIKTYHSKIYWSRFHYSCI